MSEQKHFRAVFDTNVFVAAFLSQNERSPNRELMQRWLQGDFSLIVCDYLLQEIAEKFLARRISPNLLLRLLNDLLR
ncbi:MAG: PIN domain-containing protein, partial [Chloroflexi bacterium]|nr:PIN domain-containing protein [Chloroflexota bacterium]